MKTVGCFDDGADLAGGEGEGDGVEFLRHLAPGEKAEIPAFLAVGAQGDLPGHGREIFALADAFGRGERFLASADENLGGSDLLGNLEIPSVAVVVSVDIGICDLYRAADDFLLEPE